MPLYRFPFGNDSGWSIGQDNWDNTGTYSHCKTFAWDFGHPEGGEVRAARAGVVIDTITNVTANEADDPAAAGGGNAVLIQHCDGTVATYAHLKHGGIKVKVHDWVAQGEPIALSGNTGSSTAPHLHFEARFSGASYAQLGPPIAVHFDNGSGQGWRARSGEAPVFNNTVLRQDGWRWCWKCQGLFFGGRAVGGVAGGVCPQDKKQHSADGSGSYILPCQSLGPHSQAGWRWCAKCQGLFFEPTQGSDCPATGSHTASGGSYFLTVNAPVTGQDNWRFCNKCRGLFFGGLPAAGTRGGKCPQDGGKHSSSTSGNYQLDLDSGVEAADVYQPGWRYCAKCHVLYFSLSSSPSSCAGTGQHVNGGNPYFMQHHSPGAPGQELWAGNGQSGWRYCSKCKALFFGDSPNAGRPGGVCPADGTHSGTGSGNYRLFNDAALCPKSTVSRSPGQDDWRFCSKCLCLFFAGNGGGVCPSDKKPHNKSNSGGYSVLEGWGG
jgi:hypothetical protein